ncbi:DNA gyrase (topoisomerase II) A subunit [gamma proteobacterium HdN1]|nr:DNA gyrase (topoisomerase II) A subunit [gamma proteobacterium HdN1]
MSELAKEILPINIEDELKKSYLDYAMSVIVGRALPDVRDGLKPVHRRVLFAMNELSNHWNKPYKKSARIVGDVIGKYHPHGDTAVYDTIVRMAQYFSLRYMLVDGQGNFGSIDGDNPAAMRYTEVRMAKIAHELLADLDKETVDFVPNYDGSEQMPSVLPTKVPNLLVNGSSGIAVGMATNIPPHNLGEVIDACFAFMDDSEITIEGLMKHIQGPDFPTYGIINGRAGIIEAYRTGRGRIRIRARATVERDAKTGRDSIIVTEIPYQLNKARLIERIAELVKEKLIEGITELRDESDKNIRIVIEVRRGENADVVLNNLYSQTQMESVFGINMVALVDGQPRLLNLRGVIEAFVRHRQEVVTRRTVYELRKARERAHILEGLAVALANIDPVIELIKSSASRAEAEERLLAQGWQPGNVIAMLERAGEAHACRPEGLPAHYGLRNGLYYLSDVQAREILEMRLHRLTGLETEKLIQEYQEKLEIIRELLAILASRERLMQVIRDELTAIREGFADARKTEIVASQLDINDEDLIPEETVVVTLSNDGYAKTQPLDHYQAQHRGGRGKAAAQVKEEDCIEHLLVVSTHDTILCFTSAGKVFWLKVYQIPQAGRQAKGRPIVNLLSLGENEKITAILPLRGYDGDRFVFMATSNGTVKKVALQEFSRPRSQGLIALELEENNRLVGVAITEGHQDIMLLSSEGKAVRFDENEVRAMGRTARGVRGMNLPEDAAVIALIVPDPDAQILTACENGFGKRTLVSEFPTKGRGGKGMIAIRTSERNGKLMGAVQVNDGNEVMLISDQGTMVRIRADEVSLMGRDTQGVTLIRLNEGERLVGIEQVEEVSDAAVEEAKASGAKKLRATDFNGESVEGIDDAEQDKTGNNGSGDTDESDDVFDGNDAE